MTTISLTAPQSPPFIVARRRRDGDGYVFFRLTHKLVTLTSNKKQLITYFATLTPRPIEWAHSVIERLRLTDMVQLAIIAHKMVQQGTAPAMAAQSVASLWGNHLSPRGKALLQATIYTALANLDDE